MAGQDARGSVNWSVLSTIGVWVVSILLAWGVVQTRVAVLENNVELLTDDIREMRSDIREMRADIKTILRRDPH